MTDIRVHRYRVEPAGRDEFLARRAELIAAMRTREPPPDSFVREPRRPKPFSPSATAMLELPDTDAA